MSNRLAQETSPYLQQHAENPVDWYPWGPEALEKARREDKPILLSVGYSACHWCHVMAHESFEDVAVAAVMNRLYVNIKVDREERPDIDQIYQTAHQVLTNRSGGWPLTMFLMPDGTPFFGGTYFPKTPRYGLSGFPTLLERVAESYLTKRGDIEKQNGELLSILGRMRPEASAATGVTLNDAPLQAAVEGAASNFDARFGGFGGAPKFPHPTDLELLMRRYAVTGEAPCRDIPLLTLRRMGEGGIYDQLGGGFCRYSVDAEWLIPHFEKMLYDNGPLLRLCADAWLISGDPLFRKLADETATWAMRDMQSPEGGYYSSLDADSEHVEGKFYVWTPDEVRAHLTPDEYAVVAPHFGLDQTPNFEEHYWHLHVARGLDTIATAQNKSLEECQQLVASARQKLFDVRKQRVHPGRDEKILVSWNALMIEGMAHASRVFQRDDWLASARRALDFIRATLWRDGALLATYKDGHAHLNAYLDDYAYLLKAVLELLQADFRIDDLHFAQALADALLERFEDKQDGGFFFTSHDHEQLIQRPKTGHDNATPSGNGVAAFAMQRLGHLLGESRYLDAAERTLKLFYPHAARGGFGAMLGALEEYLVPTDIVVLRGPEADVRNWQGQLAKLHAPRTCCIALPNEATGLPAALDKPLGASVNAWVCSGVKCLEPIVDFAQLQEMLEIRL